MAKNSNESVLAHILNSGIVDNTNPKLNDEERKIIECMEKRGAKFNNVKAEEIDELDE